MRIRIAITTILLFVIHSAYSQDIYKLRVGKPMGIHGLLVATNSGGKHSQAVLYKNGKELLRAPITVDLWNAGLVASLGLGFDPNFEIQNLDPQSSFRSLLTTYTGWSAGVGVGAPIVG